MLVLSEIIAKKYTSAYVRQYRHEISASTLEKLQNFRKILHNNKTFLFCLTTPISDDATREKVVLRISKHFDLHGGILKLVDLLIKHKRGVLIGIVFAQIEKWYYKDNNIQVFNVHTSHNLTDSDKHRALDFIKRVSGAKNVQADFCVEPKLISGMRIQSDYFLWERSINKLLRQVKQQMFARVGL